MQRLRILELEEQQEAAKEQAKLERSIVQRKNLLERSKSRSKSNGDRNATMNSRFNQSKPLIRNEAKLNDSKHSVEEDALGQGVSDLPHSPIKKVFNGPSQPVNRQQYQPGEVKVQEPKRDSPSYEQASLVEKDNQNQKYLRRTDEEKQLVSNSSQKPQMQMSENRPVDVRFAQKMESVQYNQGNVQIPGENERTDQPQYYNDQIQSFGQTREKLDQGIEQVYRDSQ